MRPRDVSKGHRGGEGRGRTSSQAFDCLCSSLSCGKRSLQRSMASFSVSEPSPLASFCLPKCSAGPGQAPPAEKCRSGKLTHLLTRSLDLVEPKRGRRSFEEVTLPRQRQEVVGSPAARTALTLAGQTTRRRSYTAWSISSMVVTAWEQPTTRARSDRTRNHREPARSLTWSK